MKLTKQKREKLEEGLIHPRYVFCLHRKDKWCLYNALTLKKCYGGKEISKVYQLTKKPIKKIVLIRKLATSNFAAGTMKEFIYNLKKAGFLVEQSFNEENFRQKIRAKLKEWECIFS